MKNLTLSLAALSLLAGFASAGTKYQVTITGTVEYNQINNGVLGGVAANENATVTFLIDDADFLNSPNFPTRGYFIEESSFNLQFDSGSLGLQNPYSGFGAMFVLRDNDPAVDGFLVSDNVDSPFGVPISQNGIFGAFEHSFLVTYPGTTLPSLDIADAVGTYDFTGLSVFNWTIDDGPANPMGMLFAELKIEQASGPLLDADISSLSLTAGGTQNMTLDGGSASAGFHYFMFGSVTGLEPGIDFGAINLPLNFDAYFMITLNKPGLGAFTGFRGQLDGNGQASASLTLPAGLDPSLTGVRIAHAYLAAETLGTPDFASNAVGLLLQP